MDDQKKQQLLEELFIVAAAKGDTELVANMLQDPQVNPSTNNNSAIMDAAKNGDKEMLAMLLEDGRIDPTYNNNILIRISASTGRLETVEVLLQDPRVDPTALNNYAIRTAITMKYADVVRLLATVPGVIVPTIDFYLNGGQVIPLKQLAMMTGCLSETNEDLLVWAAAVGSINLVRYLIRLGVDPTFANNSAVIAADQYHQIEVKNYLLALPGVHL
jgi:ankyrin repeat protein